jgi:FkbM family methyltransferase
VPAYPGRIGPARPPKPEARLMHPIVASLDRGGARPLIAFALQLRIRHLYGVRANVRYDAAERYWLFTWPDVIVPMLEPIPTSPWDFERAHADVFFQEYKPAAGDVIVDLGAGMGSELNLMCHLVGSAGHVYAVEADPRTFRCLRQRRDLNDLDNAVPIHAAITDQTAEVIISSEGHHLGHHLVEAGPGSRVPGTTVDDLVVQQGIDRIDLLKINIEGAERRAFEGMRESIRIVQNISVSCHDFIGRPTSEFIRAFLVDRGFRIKNRRADDHRDWARSWIYANRV